MVDILPYGRQWIDEKDIRAVINVLHSNYLTTGPIVEDFEKAVAQYVGSKFGIAVSSGTAALHAAMYAIGITPGDEVLVPSMTFAATANSVVFQNGRPVFIDVDPDTLLIDTKKLEGKITKKTKAIIAVDYAGQPCNYDALREIAESNNLTLVSDACHSLGAKYKGNNAGSLADLTIFSFHPVKHITTGEGGMIVTDNQSFSEKMRRFRNHGIESDYRRRDEIGTWYYEMIDLGYNYRLTDIQCALGLSQLDKLPNWIQRRREIAQQYNDAFVGEPAIKLLKVNEDSYHVYHLYVIQLNLELLKTDRATIFAALRKAGIGVNVHYIPVHMHPYYRRQYGTKEGLCPVSEYAYERILSLPMFPAMTDKDVEKVVVSLKHILRLYSL